METNSLPLIAWVAIGITLVIIAGQIDSYIGGWLLLVVTVSMVFAAHSRNDASGQPYL